jgi:hypothetical protein
MAQPQQQQRECPCWDCQAVRVAQQVEAEEQVPFRGILADLDGRALPTGVNRFDRDDIL